MDGSMWYERGGEGIFRHCTGPYAGPNSVTEAYAFEQGSGDFVDDGLPGSRRFNQGSGDFVEIDAPRTYAFGRLGQNGATSEGEVVVVDGPIEPTADPATIDAAVERSLIEQGLSYDKTAPVATAKGWPTWAKVTAGVGGAVLLLVVVSRVLRRS